ncbi:GNAT family N-acetyltransferase [Ensifer sesbaniae]|uniref:GNAT family N-acetyltransferase n=1 Tax=Ensifer sesbaniae TaxID=1214071 RepID=UPI002000E88C|nr:GNAT family N-acetyltransferase [Ensifer sesbaniae]
MDDSEDDSGYLAFDIRFRKCADEPHVLDWTVGLRRYRGDTQDEPGKVLASLTGFLAQPGYIPEYHDDWYFDVFDMRSQHAYQAFRVLVDDATLIEKALKVDSLSDEFGAIAHLDRMWVDPTVRGRGLGLRLMREAQHALGRYGLLVILKAHPDGNKVPNAALLRLAAYYQSDKQLGFKPVSKRKRPGWLVGSWHEPVVSEDDSTFFYLD